MPHHRKPRRVRKDVKYLRSQRGGGGGRRSAGAALSRAVMTGFKGIMRTVRCYEVLKILLQCRQ